MEVKGLEDILNRTTLLLTDKQDMSGDISFGFLVEGVLLVRIFLPFHYLMVILLVGFCWVAWDYGKHGLHHFIFKDVKQE